MKALLLSLALAAAAQAQQVLNVFSAANYRPGTLAPGSIAVAFAADNSTLGPMVSLQDSAGSILQATVIYYSISQVSFVVPPAVALGPASVAVPSLDGGTLTGRVTMAPISPGLFSADGSGTGLAAAMSVAPATPTGQPMLELYGTGIRGRSSIGDVICTIGGVIAPVLSADPIADLPGVDRVTVAVPRNLDATDAEIKLVVDQQAANIVTVSLAPPDPGDTRGRAVQIVGQMTLAEKVQAVHGIQDATHYRTVPAIPRLGIPELNITNGPAGATNGGPGHQGAATALPPPISLAATWDTDLARLYGSIIGLEARYLANGFVEGPDINIARVPQNGRNFEAYGEDPYLAGRMAAAHIQGMQSEGVIGEAKHYAGNNQELNRTTINDVIDERTLREIYLPAFEASVKEAGAGAVMCAYNKVNGLYSCENDLLMNRILKTEWGFDGFITSDFGAVHSTVASANAGLDVEMPTGIWFTGALEAAVQAGSVPMPLVDDKLVRRFDTMMRFGVFDAPPQNQPIPAQQDGLIARQLAEAGMVLLKNNGSLLPLDAGGLRSIALIGPYATKAKTGGGGSSLVVPAYTVDPATGIRNRAGAAVTVQVLDGSNLAQAATAAKSADVAIVMVGDDETEGSDHAISLASPQDQLIAQVAAANPRAVVVIKSGAPVLMPWVDTVPAILEAWYPGEEDGNAVAAVLFGDVNPSGKLPVTFPRNLADLPANTPVQYPGLNGDADYSEGVFVGYRHFDTSNIQSLFAFGHGLSYTTFRYSNLAIDGDSLEFDLTNTGKRAGAEVAQLYVGMPSSAAVPQPPRQLKGFRKVFLQPGETTHVHMDLDDRAFSHWDVETHSWQIAPGTYKIMIGDQTGQILK
jgi:beta-glucosidase